jgi:hypothetical protein
LPELVDFNTIGIWGAIKMFSHMIDIQNWWNWEI